MTRTRMVRMAALAAFGVMATFTVSAGPASAYHGSGSASLSASDGAVGVNQVLTGSYEFGNGLDNPTCWDPGSGVRFSFRLDNGTDLGSVDGTCSGTSSWSATTNWTPTAPGRVTITVSVLQPLIGGPGNQIGSASRRVSITGSKPSNAPSVPRNLKVTGVSTNAVSLNWDTPSSTGTAPISGYIVKWAGPTSGQIVAQATNANIGGLTAKSNYTFSVSAANAAGWSDWANISQVTATPPTPTPAPVTQQVLVGPSWQGGGPKVKSNIWTTFNDSQNLDTNAGREANLSAVGTSSSVKAVSFRSSGDLVQVRAVLKPGAKSGSFTLVESAPAVPGFTAMRVTRAITVVK